MRRRVAVVGHCEGWGGGREGGRGGVGEEGRGEEGREGGGRRGGGRVCVLISSLWEQKQTRGKTTGKRQKTNAHYLH